jgi:hypothetical protein
MRWMAPHESRSSPSQIPTLRRRSGPGGSVAGTVIFEVPTGDAKLAFVYDRLIYNEVTWDLIWSATPAHVHWCADRHVRPPPRTQRELSSAPRRLITAIPSSEGCHLEVGVSRSLFLSDASRAMAC